MDSQWNDWLRELAAAGQGGKSMVPPPITRGMAYSWPLSIEADVSADAWAADIRLSPDADATPLATFAVTVGAYSGGVTLVTLSLTALQTAFASTPDSDFDGLTEVVFNLFHTPSGGDQYRAAGTTITIAE